MQILSFTPTGIPARGESSSPAAIFRSTSSAFASACSSHTVTKEPILSSVFPICSNTERVISTALHSLLRSFSERDAAVISNNSIFYILSIPLLLEPQHSRPASEEHSAKADPVSKKDGFRPAGAAWGSSDPLRYSRRPSGAASRTWPQCSPFLFETFPPFLNGKAGQFCNMLYINLHGKNLLCLLFCQGCPLL